jgi:hypothetical protein
MTRRRFWRNDDIEDVTTHRIHEYEAKAGVSVTLPVPIENIVEQGLGLDFDWDVIEERPGEQILGGLDAANRKILLNEAHADLFEQKPGLLRSTIGHEAGHWEVDIDRSKFGQPGLFESDGSPVVFRHASKADKVIEVLLTRSLHDDRAYKLYKKLTEGQDSPEVRSAVDRYQSALLMPKWLMIEAAERYDLTNWRLGLYPLAEEAQVNISNLTVRLQRLGLIYMRDGNKTIYRSRDEFTGQKKLF